MSRYFSLTASQSVRQRVSARAQGAIKVVALALTQSLCIAVDSHAQSLDVELSGAFNNLRLQRPISVAVSPAGSRIAFADRGMEQIVVTNLAGELLWLTGAENRVSNISAVCFWNEHDLLFTERRKSTITMVSETEPEKQTEIANLDESFTKRSSFRQIVHRLKGGYLFLDEGAGRVISLNAGFAETRILIDRGSGAGNLLRPTGVAVCTNGSVVTSDRKNYPLQQFNAKGDYVIHGGWSEPQQGRGWVASAVAVDTRDRIWVADETNSQFRLFDRSGLESQSIPYANPAARVIALIGILTNHVVAVEKSGGISVYALE